MSNLNFLRVGLASYRVVRLWQRDSITMELRGWTNRRILDIDKNWIPLTDEDRTTRAWFMRDKLAELLSCFYCLTVWAAAFFALIGKRRSAVWLLDTMAAAGIAAIIQDLIPKAPATTDEDGF